MIPERSPRCAADCCEWYARNRRDLPWRQSSDPYAIWVSEIMLQQTRVAVVVERYQAFLQRFPTLVSLALAPEQDVLALWSGLGYYRRARMLHKAAQFVAEQSWRQSARRGPSNLRALPGIGAYTAAAIASIAHGEPVAVVDGNVERVLCRVAGWEAGSRKGGGAALRRKIEDLAGTASRSCAARRFQPGNDGAGRHGLHAAQSAMPGVPAERRDCKTRGEHKTPRRAPMISREVAYALSVRTSPSARTSAAGTRRPRSAAGTASREAHGDAGHVGAADAAAHPTCPPAEAAHDRAPRHHAGQLLRAHPHRV